MNRITSALFASVVAIGAAAASIFAPSSVGSIMGTFSKTVMRLERLADTKYAKADKADNRILDLETDIAMLTLKSMDMDREAEEALAAADRVRALIGPTA